MTSGRISVVAAPDAYALVLRERAAFHELYPRATIDVRVGNSRSAVAALLGADCDLAVIARELEPEERRAAVQNRISIEGYRFARDAVVMVVHASNPVENLAIEDVRKIYRGRTRRWNDLGGANLDVVPVIQPPGADITQFFVQQVMGEEPLEAPAVYAKSDSNVVERVRSDPRAIGYVSLAQAGRAPRVLRLASLIGLPYWKPDLETVYKGEYPLTRYFNVYVRDQGPRLANGFITFITSFEGQRVVRDLGLVPTSVPVRFVRRSPMLSTHSGGERN